MKFLSIGSDPEVFLERGGKVISAIGKIGGSKRRPKPLGNGFFVQEDNVLAEFNIPPQNNKEDFSASIAIGIQLIESQLEPDVKVLVAPSYTLDDDQLTHKKSRVFGCDPDINAWTGQETTMGECVKKNLRTAGGHVYVGYENPTEEINFKIAKALDIILGVPSIHIDTDMERRELYGKAGAFRHKPFGLEYRVLSSFWIADKKLIDWVYDGVQLALDFVEQGVIDTLTEIDRAYIEAAINNGNLECAEKILDDFNIKLP